MSAKAFALSVIIGAALGKGYLSTFKSASSSANKLGATLAVNNKKLETTKAVIKYRKQLQDLKAKQATLGHSNKRMDRGIADLEKRYRKAKQAAKGYGYEINKIGATQTKLIRQNTQIIRQQKAMSGKQAAAGRLGSLKTGALAGAGALWGVGQMIGGAAGIEEAEVRLGTVINAKDTEAAVRDARQHAADYARNSLASETEILNIQYALNSAGLDADAARIGSEIVSKVAKVTGGSAEGVGEIIGGVFNNFGGSLEGDTENRLKRIGDLLTKVQLKYQIRDFGQLGESFKEGAKGAIKYNVPLDQTAVILGQLNSSMVVGGSAGTAMGAILRQLGKASEEFGFQIVRNDSGQMDAIATLENLKESLTIFDDPDEKAAAIQKAFGDEGGSVVLLLEKMKELKSGFDEVKNSSDGVVNKNYEKFLNSTPGKILRLKKNVSQLGTTFAGTLLPAVNAVTAPLISLSGWAGEAIEKYPVIGHTIGAIGGGLLAFGGIVATITAIQWAWNAAMMANPIGLIIGGVAALGIAAWTLYDNWAEVWGGIMSMVEGAGEMIGGLWSWISGDEEQSKAKPKDKPGKGLKTAIAAGTAVAAVAAAPMPDVLSQPLAPAQTASSRTIQQTNNNTITINQSPGQDARQLASQVSKELARQQRSALHD